MHGDHLTSESAYNENIALPGIQAMQRELCAKPCALPPLSQSRYELMACPALYKSKVMDGTLEAPNPFSQRGTEIHRVLAKYVDHLVETRQQTDLLAFDDLVCGIDGEAGDILAGVRDRIVIDPEKVLGTESHLALDEHLSPIPYEESDPDFGFRIGAFEGTLDLVLLDGAECEIDDYKSHYQIYDADSFQVKFYALLIFQHLPQVEKVRFILEFVRYGAKRSAEFTREKDLAKLQKMALDARERQRTLHAAVLNGDDVQAMPGSHCVYCPKLQKGCPIAEINPYANQTPEERVRLGIWLAAAKKQNDVVLKDHINVNGPVKIADGNGNSYEAGFRLQNRSHYPLSCYSTIAERDPDLVSKLTISGLSAPLKTKKRIDLKEALDEKRLTTCVTKFGITGVDDDDE